MELNENAVVFGPVRFKSHGIARFESDDSNDWTAFHATFVSHDSDILRTFLCLNLNETYRSIFIEAEIIDDEKIHIKSYN